MQHYQLNSKRKHFYACQHCLLVYITADALRSHYSSTHPDTPCDVVDLDPDPLDEALEDDYTSTDHDITFSYLNNNHSNKEDEMYSINASQPSQATIIATPIVYSVSADTANNGGIALINSNNGVFNAASYSAQFAQPISYQIKAASLTPASSASTLNANLVKTTFTQNGKVAKKSTPLSNQPTLVPLQTVPIQTVILPSAQLPAPLANTTKSGKEKKIVCDTCSKTFSTIYNKRRHDDMVHNHNPQVLPKYKCSSCDKVFSSIYNKTRHENVHKPINERLKYICEHCSKGFTTPFILKTHIQRFHKT